MQKKDLVKSCCCHKDTAGGEHSPVGVGLGGGGGHCAAVGLWKILCCDIKKREAALGLRQDCWTELVAERLDLWTPCSHRTTNDPPKCSTPLGKGSVVARLDNLRVPPATDGRGWNPPLTRIMAVNRRQMDLQSRGLNQQPIQAK